MDSDDNKPNDTPISDSTETKNDTDVLGDTDTEKLDSQANADGGNVIECSDDSQKLQTNESDINEETDRNVAAENDITVATENDVDITTENDMNVARETDSNVATKSVVKVELQLKKLERIADKLSADSAVNSSQTSTKSQDTDSDSDISRSGTKTGLVKGTSYGTPLINIASSYMKLPSDNNFAKDICDVINFENLPNSTGKYKQISDLLKKVKNEVDRIQDT